MTADIIDSMKVADLKTSMVARNLSSNLLKEFLVTHLKEDVANGMVSVENYDPNILSNMSGDNFDPMSHW